jgi:hypothetical protein
MFTSILGSSDASPGNIVLAYDVDFPPTNVYAGIHKLVLNRRYDTFMTVNDDYTYEQTNEAIPNPFIETALVNQ